MSATTIFALVVATAIGAWLTPACIAGGRKHRQRWAITALLVFALPIALFGPVGWLLMAVAWLTAMVWSLTGAPGHDAGRAAA